MSLSNAPGLLFLEQALLLIGFCAMIGLSDELRICCLVVYILGHMHLNWIVQWFTDSTALWIIAAELCIISVTSRLENHTMLKYALVPLYWKAIVIMFRIVI